MQITKLISKHKGEKSFIYGYSHVYSIPVCFWALYNQSSSVLDGMFV